MPNIAIILSAGKSTRFCGTKNKVLYKINGKSVLENTLDLFDRHPDIDQIVLVLNKDNFAIKDGLKKKYRKIVCITEGGETRDESIIRGLKTLELSASLHITIHDACRPLLNPALIPAGFGKLETYDIVKTVEASDHDVILHSDQDAYQFRGREAFCLASSPDFLHSSLFGKVELETLRLNDCLSETGKLKIGLLFSNPENIKVTYPKDIYLAKYLSRKTSWS